MYCSGCGAKLPHAAPVVCPKCKTELWRNPKPCAGALVMRDRKLLMVRRGHDPWRGCWDIPGGFCEAAEHPIATAEREVLEETGMKIRVTGILGIWMDEYDRTALPEMRESTLNIYYHAIVDDCSESRHDQGEVTELGWFPPESVPTAIAFPDHVLSVLRAWREGYLGGRTTSWLPGR